MSIQAIDATSIHRLTSGQVVTDLQTCVKELVENSLDAGATNIEVRFKNYGLASIEVIDNGSGIAPADYESIALKHHTSKLHSFDEIGSVQTFGFRGEALSSLCALCDNLTMLTATEQDAPMGTVLEFDSRGRVKNRSGKAARQRGTTIVLNKLFAPLPVRRKDLEKNAKREFGKALNLLHAYALVPCSTENGGVRLTVSNQLDAGGRKTQFQTKGNGSIPSATTSLWGPKAMDNIVPLDIAFDTEAERSVLKRSGQQNTIHVQVKGFVSKFMLGCGRQSSDRQFIFVNGRPCNMPKVQKAINETYRQFNANQTPFLVADIILPSHTCDINVSPDKRTIFLHSEANVIVALKEALEKEFSVSRSTYVVHSGTSGSQNFLYEKTQDDEKEDDADGTIALETFPNVAPVQHVSLTLLSPPSTAKSMDEVLSKVDVVSVESDNAESPGQTLPLFLPYEEETAGVSRRVALPMQHSTDNIPSIEDNLPVLEEQTEVLPSTSLSGSSHCAPGPLNHRISRSFTENPTKGTLLSYFGAHSKRTATGNDPLSNNEGVLTSELSIVKRPRSDEPSPLLRREISPPFQRAVKRSRLAPPELNAPQVRDEEGILDIELTEITGDDSQKSVSEHVVTKNHLLSASFRRTSHVPLHANIIDLTDSVHGAPSIDHMSSSSDDVDNDVVLTTFVNMEKIAAFWKSSHLPRGQNQESETTVAVGGVDAPAEAAEEVLSRNICKADFPRMQVLGQFNLGFIIARLKNQDDSSIQNDDLFIIDQHASDEKYNFEALRATTKMETQRLLRPRPLDLTAADELLAIERLNILRQNGFDLQIDEDAPPHQRVKLTAIPVSKSTTFGVEDLEELIHLLHDSTPGEMVRCSKVRAMFAMRACRKSVMIGDALTLRQMKEIVSHMGTMDQPWNCPHGRPTMRYLTNLNLQSIPEQTIDWDRFLL